MTRFLCVGLFHVGEDAIELVKVRPPESLKFSQSVDRCRHILGFQSGGTTLFVNIPLNQACALKHFQVS
jgi:hypothetical protein